MKGFRHAALAGALVMAAGAVPADGLHAQSRDRIVRALEFAHGSRIGASVSDIEDADVKDTKQPRTGVIVDTVEPGGPADKAGLKAGDTITEFDGEKVRSVRQLARLEQETPPGRTVTVGLLRGGQRQTVNVTVERTASFDSFTWGPLEAPMRPATPPAPPEAPHAPRPPALTVPGAPFEVFRLGTGRRLGVSVETLDDQLAQYFGVKDGVLVRSVEKDSAAEHAGVKAGDVITAINGRQVYDSSDVTRALDRLDDTGEFTLDISRDRKTQTLKGKLETRDTRPARGRGSIVMF